MLTELERIFTEKLQEKTGWGKNEVLNIFKSSLIEASQNNSQASQNVSNVLTKREFFAASALSGMVLNKSVFANSDDKTRTAMVIIELTDELLNQLNNEK